LVWKHFNIPAKMPPTVLSVLRFDFKSSIFCSKWFFRADRQPSTLIDKTNTIHWWRYSRKQSEEKFHDKADETQEWDCQFQKFSFWFEDGSATLTIHWCGYYNRRKSLTNKSFDDETSFGSDVQNGQPRRKSCDN
jgi:hypothetical protein